MDDDAMTFETIRYEVDDRIATITFDRPDRLNALSPAMIRELRDGVRATPRPTTTSGSSLVTGNGRAFCAGADVTEIPDDGRVVYDEPYLSTYPQWEAPQEGTPPFRTMTKPILAAVNGLCCGAGLDWVTTGDIVIASDRAEFFDPHVSIGLVSGREMVRLARALPTNIAMRIALTGRHERMSAAAGLRARARLRGRRARPPARTGARDREPSSTATRRSPSAAPASPSAGASTCRCTRPRSWPRRSASGSCAPTTPRRARRRSSRSATRVAVPVMATRRASSRRSVRDVGDHVATITLNRPEVLNAFDRRCARRCATPGGGSRTTRRCTRSCCAAAGDRAFCAGLDTKQAVRPARRRVEPRGPGRAAQPEVAAGVEAGGLRGAGHLHGRRLLLRQRGRHRHLLRRRHLLRLARDLRDGLRARAGRPHAQGRPRRDAAHGAARATTSG